MTSAFVERLAQAEYEWISSRGQFFDPRPTWAEQVDLVRDTYRGRVRRQLEAMQNLGGFDAFHGGTHYILKGVHTKSQGGKLQDVNHIWQRVLDNILENGND